MVCRGGGGVGTAGLTQNISSDTMMTVSISAYEPNNPA